MSRVLLSVRDLTVSYGAAQVINGISFDVREGEIVALLGSNGAGKTTTLRTISNVPELLRSGRGSITFDDRRIDRLAAHRIARLGISHVPEGRRVFPDSTVEENLLLGAHARRDGSVVGADVDAAYDRFPILGTRRDQAAGLLSGGEQQMLAIARGLMARPKLLILDEPSLGLAPLVAQTVFDTIAQLRAESTTILLVEQMVGRTLALADRGYVLETGTVVVEGTAADLSSDPKVRAAYLGSAEP